MSQYILLWLEIIENMNNDNTYKLAWGRALLEIVCEMKEVQNENVITFDQIAKKMLKYYWNQVFFFHLKQSPLKTPVVVQETEKCIQYYIEETKSNIPVWFDYAENVLNQNSEFYNSVIKSIASKLKDDVCWRFMKSKGKTLDLYQLDKSAKTVTFTDEQVHELKEYAFVLSQLLSYRWAQLLEKFNNCPRIVSKVNGLSEEKIRRNNLTKFRDILILNMEEGKARDFYTGQLLEDNDISVDHVIPWSFMYSDDIWNLVLTSKQNNSIKSNSVPSSEVIEKLKQRNAFLLEHIKDQKYYNELKDAIENDYVDKFYLACRL